MGKTRRWRDGIPTHFGLMTWQLLPAREHFPAFAAEWDRLNRELYGGHPFFDSRFVGPLLEHFGNGRELLCIHRSAEIIDGALILRPLGLGRWELFLPSQIQAGAVLMKSARPLETLLPALPGYAWSLDLLSIDPAFSPDWSGLTLPRIVHPHAVTMTVATDGDFATYWQARPKKLRDNIRRYQRRAEKPAGHHLHQLRRSLRLPPHNITVAQIDGSIGLSQTRSRQRLILTKHTFSSHEWRKTVENAYLA
jgi:hypothetical protein